MKKRIHILGASGSGTTTIAKQISERLGYAHLDTDDYFWLPTDEPYTLQRPVYDRLKLLKADLSTANNWVLSGSLMGWGDELIPLFDLVVFIYVQPDIRLERLKQREFERYGREIFEGGSKYEASQEFLEWASSYDTGTTMGRNLQRHRKWLAELDCPILEIENDDLEASVAAVLNAACGDL